MNPIILSFDVGIINLAYCIFTYENTNWKIIEWDIINLSNREFTKCYCGIKASYIYNNNYYCKIHSKKCETLHPFEELFIMNNTNTCQYPIKDKICNKKSAFFNKSYFCKIHAKQQYNSLKKLYKIKPFKNKTINNMSFDETKYKLFKLLDEKLNLLQVDIVLIENQPCLKNPIMKSISISLYDFFLIRGIIDKSSTHSLIKDVKFISPSNKIKLTDAKDQNNLIIIKQTNKKNVYKITKELCIKYTKELLNNSEWIDFLNSKNKQDDLCDAFLQGVYYYKKICKL